MLMSAMLPSCRKHRVDRTNKDPNICAAAVISLPSNININTNNNVVITVIIGAISFEMFNTIINIIKQYKVTMENNKYDLDHASIYTEIILSASHIFTRSSIVF